MSALKEQMKEKKTTKGHDFKKNNNKVVQRDISFDKNSPRKHKIQVSKALYHIFHLPNYIWSGFKSKIAQVLISYLCIFPKEYL